MKHDSPMVRTTGRTRKSPRSSPGGVGCEGTLVKEPLTGETEKSWRSYFVILGVGMEQKVLYETGWNRILCVPDFIQGGVGARKVSPRFYLVVFEADSHQFW